MNHRICISLFLLAVSGAALASDGRFEISQHCVSLGCFPGHSGGLPIAINHPGSYVLTSNLTTDDVDQSLIDVRTHNVSIDLNGFSLRGPVSCSGTTTITCSASGVGDGVIVRPDRKGFKLSNGTIRGMGRRGIAFLGNGSPGFLIDSVGLIENAGTGLSSGVGSAGAIGRNLVVYRNGQHGINVQLASDVYIKDSIIQRNALGAQFGGYCGNNVFIGHQTTVTGLRNCVSFGNNQCAWDGGSGSC